MSSLTSSLGQTAGVTAAELRRAFDESFRVSPQLSGGQLESLLVVRAGGEVLAVPTKQIRQVTKTRRILPVPSHAAGMLGVAAVRCGLIAVYDLAELAGSGAAGQTPEWLLVLAEPQAGLAVQALESRVEVPLECIFPEDVPQPGRLVRRSARIGSGVIRVLDIAAAAEIITQRAGLAGPPRSRNQ